METSFDDEVLSEPNQVNKGNTEMPPLQPEFNKRQQESASNTEHQDDYNEKPVIRRGPNIKLPSPVLLEEPEEHEIDNSWIEEKKQELNEAFITLMFQRKYKMLRKAQVLLVLNCLLKKV